jgi:hypothetical protein
MSSNTEILIKRSLSTNKPDKLLRGELAYSYSSNTLFIGTPDANGSIEIAAYSDLTNLVPGWYGNTTNIPSVHVDAHGKVIEISNNVISTSLTINADSGGPSTVNLLEQALDIAGGDGLTSTVSGQTITLDVNDTVFRSNTAIASQYVDGSVQISGNLVVQGTQTVLDIQTLNISDPLLYLAGNNYTSDIVDIGFVGSYFGGADQRHAGVFRHAGNKDFYVFDNYNGEHTTNVIDIGDPSFRVANLHANLIGNINGNVTATYVHSHGFLAGQGTPDGTNGYSFTGDGGYDTGMFSPSDGILQLWSNDIKILEGQHGQGLTLENGAKLKDTASGALAFGYNAAADNNQGSHAIAIGAEAGQTNQAISAIAIGENAGDYQQSFSGVAIGRWAGAQSQGWASVAVGRIAGRYSQGSYSVAMGWHAAETDQGSGSVAIGESAGNSNQNDDAVAIGSYAGDDTQSYGAVAVGNYAGNDTQGWSAVAVGRNAGRTNQGLVATAIGPGAGKTDQGQGAVAVGRMAGYTSQHDYGVAIGRYAGYNTQGENAIAIGQYAGYDNQASGSIVLNASGNHLNGAQAGLYIDPIRYTEAQDADFDGFMYYNASTKEIRYSYALDGGAF